MELNGGFLLIENGSTVHFLENLEVNDFSVKCTRDGDLCGEIFDGGCVWNEGYLRVNGHATFISCDNDKIHDTTPGLGFAIYNGANGSILFEGGVTVQDMFLNDIGNDNAAIYNAGKINIMGDSVFKNIFADNFDATKPGAAIYNEEGGEITFRSKATATFVECRGDRQEVGAVRNKGSLEFSGPANFTLCESAIYNISPGSIKLSDGSVFLKNFDTGPCAGGAITNMVGALLEVPDDITFTGNSVGESPSCENIYFQEYEGAYATDYEDELFTCGP